MAKKINKVEIILKAVLAGDTKAVAPYLVSAEVDATPDEKVFVFKAEDTTKAIEIMSSESTNTSVFVLPASASNEQVKALYTHAHGGSALCIVLNGMALNLDTLVDLVSNNDNIEDLDLEGAYKAAMSPEFDPNKPAFTVDANKNESEENKMNNIKFLVTKGMKVDYIVEMVAQVAAGQVVEISKSVCDTDAEYKAVFTSAVAGVVVNHRHDDGTVTSVTVEALGFFGKIKGAFASLTSRAKSAVEGIKNKASKEGASSKEEKKDGFVAKSIAFGKKVFTASYEFAKKHAVKSLVGLGVLTVVGSFTTGMFTATLVAGAVIALGSFATSYIVSKYKKEEFVVVDAVMDAGSDAFNYGLVGAVAAGLVLALGAAVVGTVFNPAVVAYNGMTYLIVA